MSMNKTIVRFWKNVDVRGPGECWEWKGGKSNNGYGAFQYGIKKIRTHRLAYNFLVGEIPNGLHLDHLCRNRACANPAHLEPVTPRENAMRGETIVRFNSDKTHCAQGHEFTPENTARTERGTRRCKQCNRNYYHRIKHP